MALEGAAKGDHAHFFERRLLRSHAWGLALGGIRKEALNFRRDFLAVEVADRHNHQIIRCVPAFEEAPDLGAVELPDVRGGPQNRRTVGMRSVALAKSEVAQDVPWRVLGAADLFENHFALSLHLFFVEDRKADRIH